MSRREQPVTTDTGTVWPTIDGRGGEHDAVVVQTIRAMPIVSLTVTVPLLGDGSRIHLTPLRARRLAHQLIEAAAAAERA